MPINNMQNVQQAVVVAGSELRDGQIPVQLELFDAEGAPFSAGESVDLSGYVSVEDFEALVTRVEALEQGATEPTP